MKRDGTWVVLARLWVIGLVVMACAAQPSAGQALGKVKKRAKAVKQEADEQAERKEASLEDTETRVRRVLEAFRGEHDLAGLTCGWVQGDGQEGSTAVGVSSRSSGEPMRPDDRMLSGSIGKTYVAAVMLKLMEKGKVDLDAKISMWFGQEVWFERLPNARDLTLRMLMRHQTGIPRHLFLPEMQAAIKADPQREWKPQELISYVLDKEPLFAA
ncbi:MAG: beta-lactamase family protein, partial [Phycisphaerales bacterium]